ncbi:MAG: hypothetical protein NT166_29785 [Candidatus Aminicenantes bacterium]|nr:hypothetical protein [Candidatus Aminicenantes bacterium]
MAAKAPGITKVFQGSRGRFYKKAPWPPEAKIKRFVKKYLPRWRQSFFRRVYCHYPIVRRIYYLPTNIRDALRGRGKKLAPPRSKIFVGDGDFELAGQEFLGYFADLCGLEANEKILEIGSVSVAWRYR